MGKVVVVENRGDSLYRVRPQWNTAALDKELAALQKAETDYAALLYKAVNSLALLQDDADVARAAMSKVIAQWKAGLIAKSNEVPPVIPPSPANDPDTGLPWTDPDRAQDKLLLDAVNAVRGSSVSRDADLDRAALTHLRSQAATRKTGHFGDFESKPADRVAAQGFDAAQVIELLGYGQDSAAAVVAAWQASDSADLINVDVTDAGVAYKYAPEHPATHLWCLLMCEPGTPPEGSGVTETYPPKDPAKEAATKTEAGLQRIEAPKLDDLTPDKLGAAVALYAAAQAKAVAAEKELTRLMAEKMTRVWRIAELQALKTSYSAATPMDIWCAFYYDHFSVGDVLDTAEIPGWWDDDPISMSVDSGAITPRTFLTFDRPWAIAPFGETVIPNSQIRDATTMTPSQVFIDAALEPGTLKWKPTWRYGQLTEINTSNHTCSLILLPAEARLLADEARAGKTLNLDTDADLLGVPISYSPCHSYAFDVGDHVLVLFEGFDRSRPKVVGFRRAPRDCNGRESWIQIV